MFLYFQNGKLEQINQLPATKSSFPSGLSYAENVTLLPNGHKQIKWAQCNLFSSDETEKISASAKILERLFDNLYRLNAAEDAFKEFETELNSVCSNDPFAMATVDRRLRSYLFEWRLFLDHWKKYIDDGAQTVYWSDKTNSEKYIKAYQKLYKDVTTEAYDTCQEYVLATVIRNHVAHAENAINGNEVGLSGNTVYISRDVLLSSVNISKSARAVIEKQQKKINLYGVAKKSLEAAEKVMSQLMDFQIDEENVQAAYTLLKAHEKIESAGIDSDSWMISIPGEIHWEPSATQSVTAIRVKDENGNPVNEKPIEMKLMMQSLELAYQPLNWKGYLAYSGLLTHKYETGEWQAVQQKYFEEE